MLKRIAASVALLLLAGMQLTTAAVYQWRDASGITHFTDNPNQVPPQHRKHTVGGLIGSSSLPAGANQAKSATRLPAKYKVWAEKCASCHHAGEGVKGKLKGLAHLTINRSTRFPATIDEIVKQLRYAANGRYSDMDRMDVSDAELRSIAQYLLSANK